jgi:MMP 1-O-methyltransferase
MVSILKRIKRKLFKDNLSSIINKVSIIEGWLTENEIRGLYNVARKLPNNSTVVEIGSWKGKSTITIGLGLRKGIVYAIDPFNAEGEPGSKEEYLLKQGNEPLLYQFLNNIKKHGVAKFIIPLRGYSFEFSTYIDDIDFLFIDGDHSIEGCSNDFNLYSEKVKKGGYIGFHDFYPERIDLGPTWVINNLLINNNHFEHIGVFDSLWIAKRI